MKKQYLLMIMFAASFILNAGIAKGATINVEVEDFEFNPTTFIANVGDTVHWFWDEGFHTTTSFLIPAGAAAWNQPIFDGSPTFDYIITVPGSYDYICTPHSSMGMTGHFTALAATGLPENLQPSLSLVEQYISNGNLSVTYTLPSSSAVSLGLYNITGNLVHAEELTMAAGTHNNSFYVGALPKGIYILELVSRHGKIAHKFTSQ